MPITTAIPTDTTPNAMIALKPAADNSVPVATKLSKPACTVASTAAYEVAGANTPVTAAATANALTANVFLNLFLIFLNTTISPF